MQMLKNLFKSDKKYYLELTEEKASEAVESTVQTASKAIDTVQEKATEVLESQPVTEVVKTTEKAVESAEAKLTSTIKEKTPVTAKSKKSKGKAAKSQAESQSTKATPKNSAASSYDQPFWVAAMYNNNGSSGNNSNNNGSAGSETFATKNLMPAPNNYRRRPGGSLNKFKDMAKSVKTPRG